jgi:hypothetical protein
MPRKSVINGRRIQQPKTKDFYIDKNGFMRFVRKNKPDGFATQAHHKKFGSRVVNGKQFKRPKHRD